ncbi:MAG: tRNA-specific adenosine deaminase [Phycisphaerae bacterium]|nr:tRNA-specific adenosine deaminase [Phycisphaerae bacterium]
MENGWLREAIAEAEKSWSQGGIPIGSVIVTSDGIVVGRGHNERVQTGDPTAHAEVVAFRNAGRRRDWGDLILVSTLSPCIMCTGTALLFGIKRVIIGENKNFLGAEALMCSNGVQVDVLNDKGCIELMDRMKKEKPDLWAEDIGK